MGIRAVFFLFCILILSARTVWSAEGYTRGLNVPRIDSENSFLGDEDYRLIASSGFDFIRIPFDPTLIYSTSLSSAMMESLSGAVRAANKHGLAVILDAHPSPSYKLDLFKSKSSQNSFALMWLELAFAFKSHKAELAFELLNEPGRNSHGQWWSFQEQVIREIREVDPDRFIVVNAEGVSTVSDLTRQLPYAYDFLIYNFHFYNPMVFSHQGAHWGSRKYEKVRGIPWPFDRETLIEHGVTEVDGLMEGKRRWRKADIDVVMQRMARWARKYGVAVMCNEFGVYARGGVDPDSRNQYLSDVVGAFETNKIPWALWEYRGGFGVVLHASMGAAAASHNRGPVIDPRILRALGMNQ